MSASDGGSYTYAETGYANPHAVTSVGGTAYAYDNNGNVTSAGNRGYEWDYQNRLIAAGTALGTTTYGYDHTGERVFKAMGSATTSYPNMYYNTDGTTETMHIFSPDGTLLAVVSSTTEGQMLGAATSFSGMTPSEGQSILSLIDGKTAAEAAISKRRRSSNGFRPASMKTSPMACTLRSKTSKR